MIGRMRFYCTKCNRFEDRREVYADEWECIYNCKTCGETVMRTRKVFKDMVRDYIGYIIEKGNVEDYQ